MSESPHSNEGAAAAGGARRMQVAIGLAVAAIGVAYGVGAWFIPSEAGYGGVGPNFLPWLVALALTLCGALLVREALTGGYRQMGEPSGAERGWWPGLLWVSAGMLLNAALITVIGFILSCALCYLLAVQGLRRAQGQPAALSLGTWAADALTGIVIAAPVFWLFTQFLAINLPGLTKTGWL